MLGIKENGWAEGKIWPCLWPLCVVTKNSDKPKKALYVDISVGLPFFLTENDFGIVAAVELWVVKHWGPVSVFH